MMIMIMIDYGKVYIYKSMAPKSCYTALTTIYFKNANFFPCDSTQSAARLIMDCHTLLNAELFFIYLHSAVITPYY
jgi:hypothetical protein